jgi:putative ATP-dependent endonuclease of OLD family
MRLVSITSKNYRTLEDIKIDIPRSYCAVSGKNNAGKSALIRLLSILFSASTARAWRASEFDYKVDKTQWAAEDSSIHVELELEITKIEDPALVSFVEKMASVGIESNTAIINIIYEIPGEAGAHIKVTIDGDEADEKAAKEIVKRIKDSNLLFLYNSTTRGDDRLYFYGSGRDFYEFIMSAEEKKLVHASIKQLERKMRGVAKQRTVGLSQLLSRLSDKYEVELSPIEAYTSDDVPVGINLKDRNVDIPLGDWGSGTQNRTRILMAILQAARIKTVDQPDERITPIVVVEEPECFLHPSAQAEFGKLLRHLSSELEIQILVTTHSPHMLNHEIPEANILLDRKIRRKKQYETFRVTTEGEAWMAPFADHLGLCGEDFNPLRPLFASDKRNALLVEGNLDKEYFEHLQTHELPCGLLSENIAVVPYGGKDTLKNTILLQFVLSTFDKVFVTYDLDAKGDVRAPLERLGLKEGHDCMALGKNKAGYDCIEGLLPDRVLGEVTGSQPELVMKLTSKNNKDRKSAKEALKKLYLATFKTIADVTIDEVAELKKVIMCINKNIC